MYLPVKKLIAKIDLDFYLTQLSAIYSSMDSEYSKAAAFYGFNCTGCDDNCCLTRFHHHTILEYLYILEGFDHLETEKQIKIKAKAFKVRQKSIKADKEGKRLRQMCPLNSDGKCVLYSSRPMICRLHGIPHELHTPGRNIVCQPGCETFSEQFGEKDYHRFDRTPFYLEIASLEKDLKQAADITTKIKMTIADMLA